MKESVSKNETNNKKSKDDRKDNSISSDNDEESSDSPKKGFRFPTPPPFLRIILIILADLITTLNFVSGVIAIVLICIDPQSTIYFLWACRLILLAIIFDFADGIPARLANKEPGFFGTIIDSIADSVSFGLAPGILIAFSYPFSNPQNQSYLVVAIFSVIIGVYFASCALYRLIRFTKAPSKKWFKGIPAPGAGCAAALYGIMRLYLENNLNWSSLSIPIVGLLCMVLTATMMIVKIRYPTTKLRKNPIEIFLLGLTAVVLFSLAFIPLK
ncbi:hypothetical protein EU523_01490, partial [Candidatus Heimdallarchaeota archaeon]